jgi:hypothetical protein
MKPLIRHCIHIRFALEGDSDEQSSKQENMTIRILLLVRTAVAVGLAPGIIGCACGG